MARARILKPGFFSNEDLCELPAFARLLFAGLWTLADKKGRLDDRPKRIKAELFPYDSVNVVTLLDRLEERGFIIRYAVGDAKFIQIASFEKHQHPHKNEPDSVLPGPEGECVCAASDIVRSPTDISGSRPADTVTVRNTEANTDTEAEADADEPPAHPFSLTYVKRYQERHAGQRPPQTEHAAALAIEREYGAAACIQLGSDLDWSKHPNYMRPILEERRNGDTNRTDRGKPATSADTGLVATGVSDLERRRAALAERRRTGVT